MKKENLWFRTKDIHLQTSENVGSGFDIGFDKRIPIETQNELCKFVKWVEQNFNIPISVWVDFEYKHYLVKRDGNRVGYLFYWADFISYPMFTNKEDVPVIRLPVRTEHSTMVEILRSFIEAISDYFAWVCNEISDSYEVDEEYIDEILHLYLNSEK